MITSGTLIGAVLGGILPAVLWLFFWLKEDRLHPEPKRLVFLSFVLGMAAVPLVVPLEQLTHNLIGTGIFIIFIWALIEELFKYVAAYLSGLHSKALDEPIDAMIYMISAALGFAALENVLFLIDPLMAGDIFLGVVAGNVRFIGASLLHTISSSAIGLAIALSFYKSLKVKILYRIIGVGIAVFLHALFNLFILDSTSNSGIFTVFFFVWLAVILLILFFEKVKRVTKESSLIT